MCINAKTTQLSNHTVEKFCTGDMVCWVDRGIADQTGLAGPTQKIGNTLNKLVQETCPADQIFKDDSRSRVWLVTHEGKRWVVKQYRAPAWQTWLYNTVRRTPAWREWLGSHLLARVGCKVNTPLALVDHHKIFRNRRQWLVFPYVEGQSLYHWLIETASAPQVAMLRRRVAAAIGRLIGQMTHAGIINRDLKPSNLIIDTACEQDGESPTMIDLAGLSRSRRQSRVYQMLARFYRSIQDQHGVTNREALTCLHAILKTDPSLSQGKRNRLRLAVNQIIN